MKRLLTITEAGDALRVGRTKAFELARTGALPTITIGCRRYVRATDVERIQQEGTQA